MKKKYDGVPKGKLLVCTVIGVCLGIVVFLVSELVTKGINPTWSALTAILSGLLSLTFCAAVVLFYHYKRKCNSVEESSNQASTDKSEINYNNSFLDPFLDGEIEAAKKENQPVSVIITALDHFREINKTYGRVVGDHILAIFAQVVLKCIRQTDIISRYNGDEMIIILPNTEIETATNIADKIRETVAGTYIPPVDNVVISSIHCSIGVSTFPIQSDSRTSLIRASELALSMAKRSGRNTTMVYENKFAIS